VPEPSICQRLRRGGLSRGNGLTRRQHGLWPVSVGLCAHQRLGQSASLAQSDTSSRSGMSLRRPSSSSGSRGNAALTGEHAGAVALGHAMFVADLDTEKAR
jgi:hypothetical protein